MREFKELIGFEGPRGDRTAILLGRKDSDADVRIGIDKNVETECGSKRYRANIKSWCTTKELITITKALVELELEG